MLAASRLDQQRAPERLGAHGPKDIIDFFVSALRRKLDVDSSPLSVIRTVRAVSGHTIRA